jgi:hypothetical protein
VHVLYRKYVTAHVRAAEVDPEVAHEYSRQRQYLERTVDALKRKMERDGEAGAHENLRVMQENVALVKEINELRREIRSIRQQQRERELTGKGGAGQTGRTGSAAAGLGAAGSADEEAASRELEAQRQRIAELRAHLEALGHSRQAARPLAREVLPPIH